jgi:O-antigen/teichoic acid export membrane protein
LLVLPLFALMALTRYAAGSTVELQLLLATFGVAQVITIINDTLAAMLQAATRVNALAAVNVAAKLTWGIGVLIAVVFRAPLIGLVLPSVISELLRLVVLIRSARREVGLQFRFSYVATRRVVIASLPYYVNAVSIVLMNRLDIMTLEFFAPEQEVGWYGAANNLASLP